MQLGDLLQRGQCLQKAGVLLVKVGACGELAREQDVGDLFSIGTWWYSEAIWQTLESASKAFCTVKPASLRAAISTPMPADSTTAVGVHEEGVPANLASGVPASLASGVPASWVLGVPACTEPGGC